MRLQRLIKLTIEECKKRFPNGYTKSQMVSISDEIKKRQKICNPVLFGKIESDDDIVKQRNNMIADGHYPASISSCEVVGINGDCGIKCPVFLNGDCKLEDEDSFVNCINKDVEDEEELDNINIYQALDMFTKLRDRHIFRFLFRHYFIYFWVVRIRTIQM